MNDSEGKKGSSQLDLAILTDQSSWTVESFIESGGDKFYKRLEEGLGHLHVDLSVTALSYGENTIYNDLPSAQPRAFSSDFSDVLAQQQKKFTEADDTDALTTIIDQASQLKWRTDATKVCCIITDNPPKALSLKCQPALDIFVATRKLARKGVIINTIGIEPRIKAYKDFFMALSYISGGRYIALTDAYKLVDAILGAVVEDRSLENILPLVDDRTINYITGIGPSEDDIGKFYNIVDQHFNETFNLIGQSATEGKIPRTEHLCENSFANGYVSPLARYLSTFKSIADLKRICPAWPLPWPEFYVFPPPPPTQPRPPPLKTCFAAAPPPSTSGHGLSTLLPAPPPPPPPPTSNSSYRPPPSPCLLTEHSRKAPSTPSPPCPPPPTQLPPPPLSAMSPPPPPPPPPLRRRNPPNPRELQIPDFLKETGGSYTKIKMADHGDFPPVPPFAGSYYFEKQVFEIRGSQITYGQMHRLVQRVLARRPE